MKLTNAMLGGLLLAVAPLTAHAEGMSYSYIELDWAHTDVDNGPSGDGIHAEGSVGFANNFFVFANYATLDVDVVDIDTYIVGLGGHVGITESLDFVGRVGYTSLDLSLAGGGASTDGYHLAAGLRGRVADQFELEGDIIYRDLGNEGGEETAFSFGGRYHLTDAFALGVEYQFGEDADTLFAGVRFSF